MSQHYREKSSVARNLCVCLLLFPTITFAHSNWASLYCVPGQELCSSGQSGSAEQNSNLPHRILVASKDTLHFAFNVADHKKRMIQGEIDASFTAIKSKQKTTLLERQPVGGGVAVQGSVKSSLKRGDKVVLTIGFRPGIDMYSNSHSSQIADDIEYTHSVTVDVPASRELVFDVSLGVEPHKVTATDKSEAITNLMRTDKEFKRFEGFLEANAKFWVVEAKAHGGFEKGSEEIKSNSDSTLSGITTKREWVIFVPDEGVLNVILKR